jgi:hypothetical protein
MLAGDPLSLDATHGAFLPAWEPSFGPIDARASLAETDHFANNLHWSREACTPSHREKPRRSTQVLPEPCSRSSRGCHVHAADDPALVRPLRLVEATRAYWMREKFDRRPDGDMN